MNIEIGNTVRLDHTYELREGHNWVQFDNRTPLNVRSKDNHDNKEYCKVTGNGFSLEIECDKLTIIKEKRKINVRFLQEQKKSM